jgi:hypothetical protein
LTFLNKSGEGSADVDVTQDVSKTLQEKYPEVLSCIASANVFPLSGDGPKGMASRFNVRYLGAIPLDPNLLKSCENGLC